MFLVWSSNMLDIVMINDEYMHMFAKLLAQFLRQLSGRHYVSMVLRYCLHADVFCTLGHVVDHGCDTPIESLYLFIYDSMLLQYYVAIYYVPSLLQLYT